jgi:hypothetical protein
MNEVEKEKPNKPDSTEQPERRQRRSRAVRKTQSQVLQESLGLNPEDIKTVEDKLSVVKFLDYLSEEPLDFIFKDRTVDQYLKKIEDKIELFDKGGEEERFLKKKFEDDRILDIIKGIKNKTEDMALKKGITTSVDKRLRRLSLLITLPMLAIAVIFLVLPAIGLPIDPLFMLPVLCVFCMLPQLVRGSVVKKWFRFKEEARTEIYSENREDILIVKSFIGELLSDIRSGLIELNVPLELIKFSLFNRNYEYLNIINQRPLRGLVEYYVTFKYPEGMEPIPIPEQFRQQVTTPEVEEKKEAKPEQNFIVLTEMKGTNGIISDFVPSLKDKYADKINQMLSNCDFGESNLSFDEIIPNYSESLGIYCVCGDIAKIEIVNICNWKNQFKFYLFEGESCNCGEKVYALSLMDENTEVPSELKEIFSS